jgi:hypothetical protein
MSPLATQRALEACRISSVRDGQRVSLTKDPSLRQTTRTLYNDGHAIDRLQITSRTGATTNPPVPPLNNAARLFQGRSIPPPGVAIRTGVLNAEASPAPVAATMGRNANA